MMMMRRTSERTQNPNLLLYVARSPSGRVLGDRCHYSPPRHSGQLRISDPCEFVRKRVLSERTSGRTL